MDKKIYEKIISKKEFSDLPKKDVEMVFSIFDKKDYLDLEKIKLTRDLLRKMYSAFTSQKLLSPKNKSFEWILNKHLSTKERLPYYEEIYSRLLKDHKKITIIDLGAGVNGFSYEYFSKMGIEVNYIATEAMGQLVDLMNNYFVEKKFNAKADRLSLFELSKNVKLIKKHRPVYPNTLNSGAERKTVVFLFKALDSLEMLKRDYSKELLKSIVPLVEKVVISFATRSLVSKKKFHAQRKWLTDFIKEEFKVLDDFEIGTERYIVFSKNN